MILHHIALHPASFIQFHLSMSMKKAMISFEKWKENRSVFYLWLKRAGTLICKFNLTFWLEISNFWKINNTKIQPFSFIVERRPSPLIFLIWPRTEFNDKQNNGVGKYKWNIFEKCKSQMMFEHLLGKVKLHFATS